MRAAILTLALAFNGALRSAQSYPSKPIRIVVPFAAGGITDVSARALGQRLAEAWGQQVVIENKPGGGTGQVGTEYVARSAPDGYTLLVTADATFVTAPHTYSRLPYDAINDFVPITALGISPQALVVHPSLPVLTLADLVELAKKKPGEINYGTFGIGSSGHLNIILLEGMTGTNFTPVHYRGAAPAITTCRRPHQMMIVSIGPSAVVAGGWAQGARLAARRIAQYPDVPAGGGGLPLRGRPWMLGGAQRHAARDIVKLNGNAAHLQRFGISAAVPGAKLIFPRARRSLRRTIRTGRRNG